MPLLYWHRSSNKLSLIFETHWISLNLETARIPTWLKLNVLSLILFDLLVENFECNFTPFNSTAQTCGLPLIALLVEDFWEFNSSTSLSNFRPTIGRSVYFQRVENTIETTVICNQFSSSKVTTKKYNIPIRFLFVWLPRVGYSYFMWLHH